VPIPIMIEAELHQAPENQFFDVVQGNKYTHVNRIFDLSHNFEGILKNEFSLDWFGGLIFGDFPLFKEMYGADVQNAKVQVSVNITATLKFELFEFFRYEFEF
jgi:hypothetical protein